MNADPPLSGDAIGGLGLSFSAQILQLCLTFTIHNFFVCLKRLIFPLIIGGIFCLIFLSLYMSQLTAYLHEPVGRIGSRVLGVAAAGSLVMLFLHSVVVASITEIIVGRKVSDRGFLGIKRWQWCLYVANLKLFMIAVACATLFLVSHSAITHLNFPRTMNVALDAVLAVPLFWSLARAWFFLLPVSLETGEGEVLAKSWRLSKGYSWGIAAILLPIFLVVLAFQGSEEMFLRALHFLSPLRTGNSLSANLILLREFIGPIMILMMLNYFFVAVLTTAARIYTYDKVVCCLLPRVERRERSLR